MNAEQFYRKHFYLESKTEFENNKTVTKEGCLNVMTKFAEQEVNENREIWSKQEKDLIDQIVSLNNTIAELKEKLYCSNCGWDNKYPKLKKAKLCLAYDDRDNCEDFKKVSNACISCNMYNNPEHQ